MEQYLFVVACLVFFAVFVGGLFYSLWQLEEDMTQGEQLKRDTEHLAQIDPFKDAA